MGGGGRLGFLDALRGIAALVVVFHHGLIGVDFAFYSGAPADSRLGWDIWLSGKPFFIVNAGNYAVCLFLTLSGFVLTHAYQSTRLGSIPLALKRYLRLTIPILAASILSLVVWLAVFGMPAPGTTSPIWTIIALLEAARFCLVEALWNATFTGLGMVTYNGVLWTMQIEFIGSVMLIALFQCAKLGVRLEVDKTLTLTGLAALLTVVLWSSYLGMFAEGALLQIAAARSRPAASFRGASTALLLLVAGVLFGTMPESNARADFYTPFLLATGTDPLVLLLRTPLHYLMLVVSPGGPIPFPLSPVSLWHAIGAVFTLAGVLWLRPARNALQHPLLRWLGHISFPLYLVHGILRGALYLPLFGWLRTRGISFAPAMFEALAVFVAASLATAHAFAYLVEDRAVYWSASAADYAQGIFRRKAKLMQ